MNRLRNAFEQQAFLLDLEATDLAEVFRQSVVALVGKGLIPAEQAAAVEAELHRRENISSTAIGNAVSIPHAYLDGLSIPVVFFVRLKRGINMGAPDLRPTRYLFILTGPIRRASEHLDTLTEIARGMSDKDFRYDLRQALTQTELLAAADAFTSRSSPDRPRMRREDGLAPARRFAGGLLADIQRKAAVYWSDFRDGLNTRTLSATLFLTFACLAPAIALGGLLGQVTQGQLGVVEMLLATAAGGVIFSLCGGQPLVMLGATGPHLVLTGVLYQLCQKYQIPFLPFFAAVGLWSGMWLLVLSVTGASSLLRSATRFTDELFAALVSAIYLQAAGSSLWGMLQQARSNSAVDPVSKMAESDQAAAFLAMLLALGTFGGTFALRRLRKTRYLSRGLREFLADFGPTLAILAMLLFSQLFPLVALDTVPAPAAFGPSAEAGRSWLIPLQEVTPALWLLAALVAIPVTILTFLEQTISAKLVNSPDHPLRKGPGYHLDLAVLGIIRLVGSPLGFPWIAAAAVRSLYHVRALATVEEKLGRDGERREEIIHVVETRLTGLLINVAMGASLLLLPWLQMIPLAVLSGLILYMGLVSLSGNQFLERLMLWLTDSALYPKTHYTRTVPTRTIHMFTAVQAACCAVVLGVLWSPLTLLFPVCLAVMIPLRQQLDHWFQPAHLALLDAVTEAQPEEPQGV